MVLNSIRNQKKTKHNFLLIILIIFNASLIGISSHTNKEYLNLNNVSDNNPSLKDDSSSTLMISDITNSENESLTIVSYDQYSVYNTSLNHTLYSNYGANPPDFLREFITNVNFITGQHSTDGGNINSLEDLKYNDGQKYEIKGTWNPSVSSYIWNIEFIFDVDLNTFPLDYYDIYLTCHIDAPASGGTVQLQGLIDNPNSQTWINIDRGAISTDKIDINNFFLERCTRFRLIGVTSNDKVIKIEQMYVIMTHEGDIGKYKRFNDNLNDVDITYSTGYVHKHEDDWWVNDDYYWMCDSCKVSHYSSYDTAWWSECSTSCDVRFRAYLNLPKMSFIHINDFEIDLTGYYYAMADTSPPAPIGNTHYVYAYLRNDGEWEYSKSLSHSSVRNKITTSWDYDDFGITSSSNGNVFNYLKWDGTREQWYIDLRTYGYAWGDWWAFATTRASVSILLDELICNIQFYGYDYESSYYDYPRISQVMVEPDIISPAETFNIMAEIEGNGYYNSGIERVDYYILQKDGSWETNSWQELTDITGNQYRKTLSSNTFEEGEYECWIKVTDNSGYVTCETFDFKIGNYEKFLSTQLDFSLKEYHVLTDNSKITLSLSDFTNPYDDNYLKIETGSGDQYDEIIYLPRTNTTTDVQIDIPINLNNISSNTLADGWVYSDNLTFYTKYKDFTVSNLNLFLEDKYNGSGPIYYDKERGYIDFTVEADTFIGTAWQGSRVEIYMPKNQELKDFYGLTEDVYYDQLWSVERIDSITGTSYTTTSPFSYDYDFHILCIESDYTPTGSLYPHVYRIYFNKKPLDFSCYIQKPDLELGYDIFQTSEMDYEDYSLYCRIFDPNPISNITDLPYFMNTTDYQPTISYNVLNVGTINGSYFENGINNESFLYNLDAGQYEFFTYLDNVLDPVYNTYIFDTGFINFYEQPHFEISPQFSSSYFEDSGFPYNVELISPDGAVLNLPNIKVEAEKAYWDSHDSISQDLSVFANYSGNIYHFDTGTPSSSFNLTNGLPAHTLLNDMTYPDNSLIMAPEILEFNPSTNFSRQQIEIFIQLDLSEIIELNNLEAIKDLSFLNATIFGSSFIDSSQEDTDIIDSYGRLQIYNFLTGQYDSLSNDYILYSTLEQGNQNNELTLEDIEDCTFQLIDDDIPRYIDSSNKITFRILSYFEGYIRESNTYLSSFDKSNSILGVLLDHVNFDIAWWKNSPNLVNYSQSDIITSGQIYTYTPTYPGTYNINFEYNDSLSYYLPTTEMININIERRPVNIELTVPFEEYSTGNVVIMANVSDLTSGGPAINAKVLFHSLYNSTDILLGESITGVDGLATLSINNLNSGNHSIWAETIPNNGKYVKPYKDEPFIYDKWASNFSNTSPLEIKLSQSTLELVSLAPGGIDVVVDQNFFIYPRIIDQYTGDEVVNQNISIYVNSTFKGYCLSSHLYSLNFTEPGQFSVNAFFNGSSILNESQNSIVFNVIRLSLTITEISPAESYYYPNQLINLTVIAYDLATKAPINNLSISLYNNITAEPISTGYSNVDGIITFSIPILENWASKDILFFAANAPIENMYLKQNSNEVPVKIRPYYCNISLDINATELYVNEFYNYNFNLWNVDLQQVIESENLNIAIMKDGATLFEYSIITSINNSLILEFPGVGIYEIIVGFYGSDLYLMCFESFTINIQKRPTMIEIAMTDIDLVPGNEFSITVNLIDILTNQSILNKYLNITEFIYSNGSLVESKNPFTINTQYTSTFSWIPLRSADFEFVFTFDYYQNQLDPIYQNSNYSIIFNVEKRQVWIESFINDNNFKIGDIVQINSTFSDFNTMTLDPISGLLVHYLVLDNEEIVYSENFTTSEQGMINFEWIIPSNLINKTLDILIISADTNYYQWNYAEFEISTLPVQTYFNITMYPNLINYVNVDTIFNIELLDIWNQNIETIVNYEISCAQNSFFTSGMINLTENSVLTLSILEVGEYSIKFFYEGSSTYNSTELEEAFYIELRPSELEMIEWPDFIYTSQESINITCRLLDRISWQPIENNLVKLYYIDPILIHKVYLGVEESTDSNGLVSFIVDLPESYNSSKIIFLVETSNSQFNNGSFSSVEIFITLCPTFINYKSQSDQFQFYIGDSLDAHIQLYDYFNNLILSEELIISIITPNETISNTILSNQSILINFTQIGIYTINISYNGNENYLSSTIQIAYPVNPIPTSLKFIESIPNILYIEELLYLKAQLKNNMSQTPLEGKIVDFYMVNHNSTYLIFSGITDENGFISHVWEATKEFANQSINIYAEFAHDYPYGNSITSNNSVFISKSNIELILMEFPEIITPEVTVHFEMMTIQRPSGRIANGTQLQIYIMYPNGSQKLILDDFTNSEGILIFNWVPSRNIFNYNNFDIEIYALDGEDYNGGLVYSGNVMINKIQTFISIVPDKTQSLPNETVPIHFTLCNIFDEILIGEIVEVEITNLLYSTNFIVIIGFNDTYEFIIPNLGVFEITAIYNGDERNYESSNNIIIYSEKIEINLDFYILESFTKIKSIGFLGFHWNYSVLDCYKNFTLIANITVKGYNIPIEGVDVLFYYVQHFADPILIGSNITNSDGIAMFKWDTSNYTMPSFCSASALYAKVEENEGLNEVVSDPVYFTLRKIFTSIDIETHNSKLRINVPYEIDISLYDEFSIELKDLNLTVKIYDPDCYLIQMENVIAGDNAHFRFIPTKLGSYRIEVKFKGTNQYRASCKSKQFKCFEKEPTSINIIMPDKIYPGLPQEITIELLNSTGDLVIGEIVRALIMYHDNDGKTQCKHLIVLMGENNTFEWIFPEYDEYLIKASFSETDDFLGCSKTKISASLDIFKFSFWEILFFIFTPCIVFVPRKRKSRGLSKGKKKIAALGLIFAILGSAYAGIALSSNLIETTGFIQDFSYESDYESEDSIFGDQNQEMMNDLLDISTSQVESSATNINPESIPNLVNESSPYDIIIQNSTVIPPEADSIPPYIQFMNVKEGQLITGLFSIKVDTFDQETGIKEVFFKLYYKNNLVEEAEFEYDEIENCYVYSLSSLEHADGEYDIYVVSIDNNNNNATESLEVEIFNHPENSIDDFSEFNYLIVELTDSINLTFSSITDGIYNIQIKNNENKVLIWLSGIVNAYGNFLVNIPIEPLIFKEGQYKIILSISAFLSGGFFKTETKELDLLVQKETAKLELDILEGENIYSDSLITFRARLIEDDWIISEDGNIKDANEITPIPGQVLTFEISDEDNYEVLGTAITDSNGYAYFTYEVDLFKGYHLFNVTFQGNNIYKSYEGMKLFENKGELTFIELFDINNPIEYNTIGSITAKVYDDQNILPGQTLYFNISNALENQYIGMATTDSFGIARIEFPCNYVPGSYNIIISTNGDFTYSENIVFFNESLLITKQNTKLSIITNGGSDIYCPYNYDTQINSKLVVNNTFIGIAGIPLIFELIDNSISHTLGTVNTDSNGFASLTFNPTNYGLIPGDYFFNIYSDESKFYTTDSDYVSLHIQKDIPIISIEGTNAYFFEEVHINATLTDSLLNPLSGKELLFYIINSSSNEILNDVENGANIATTDENGAAALIISSYNFQYFGSFAIEVQYLGVNDDIETAASHRIENGLNIFSRETNLYIQGPNECNPLESLEIELLLTDNGGNSIGGQQLVIECYRENSTTNLIENTVIFTDIFSGIAQYHVPLLLIGSYVLRAYYLPQSDSFSSNDGFIESQVEFHFEITRVQPEISVKNINLQRAYRGDVLEFTVSVGSEAAKDYIIPVRVYVNLDINGDDIKRDDVLGELRFLYYGEGTFSYQIPLGSLYQAGVYNFSIEIEEEGSIFSGSTSISIDIVERTTLSIDYETLNPLADGKHYIWEPEKINFTLLDEDGIPLPESKVYNYNGDLINRLIYYSIINGKNIFGSGEVNLADGIYTIVHKPESYGFETCSAIYKGSRFFAPSTQKDKVEILKRPFILNFLDFYHNNPNRTALPHSGHRDENIYIEASVQDYLNLSYLTGFEVSVEVSNRDLKISGLSNGDGMVIIEVPLTAENGLMQAGVYNLSTKINSTEQFASIKTFHPESLYIFEIGYYRSNVGDFSTQGMNFVSEPVIYYFDEDDQLISSQPFYLEIKDKDTDEVVLSGFYTSGKINIPAFRGGEYIVHLTVLNTDIARSGDIDTLAENYVDNNTFYISSLSMSYGMVIKDPGIIPFTIPFLSYVISQALQESINYNAEPIVTSILFILHVFFGVTYSITGEKIIDWPITFGMLFKFIVISLILNIPDSKYAAFGVPNFGKVFGVIVLGGETLLTSICVLLSKPTWMWDFFTLLFISVGGLTVGAVLNKVKSILSEELPTVIKSIKRDMALYACQIIILIIIGVFYFIENSLEQTFGKGNLFTQLFKVVEGGLWGAWSAITIFYIEWGGLFLKDGKTNWGLVLEVLLITVVLHLLMNAVILLVDWLVNIFFPYGGMFEAVVSYLRSIFRIVLRYALVIICFAILFYINLCSSAFKMIGSAFLGFVADQLIGNLFELMMIAIISSLIQLVSIPQAV